MKTLNQIVKELTKREETISTMESCTGGGLANAITCVEGASQVLKFSAITYCNEYKIKMGVDAKVIDKYSVYSIETAREMAINISKFANSDFGVGITGKLNRADKKNNYGKDNEVFVSIYYKNKYYDINLIVDKKTRKENKQIVISRITEKLGEIIWEEGLIR